MKSSCMGPAPSSDMPANRSVCRSPSRPLPAPPMLKPSTMRPFRAAIVRKVASTCGTRFSVTTVSMGTVPSFESHHMLEPMPLGKTTIMGGILPCVMALPYHELSHAMPEVGLPLPCSQYSTGNRAVVSVAYSGGR